MRLKRKSEKTWLPSKSSFFTRVVLPSSTLMVTATRFCANSCTSGVILTLFLPCSRYAPSKARKARIKASWLKKSPLAKPDDANACAVL